MSKLGSFFSFQTVQIKEEFGMLQKDMNPQLGLNGYLKIREAAAFLGVHPDTLRRWERNHKVSTYRHPVNRYRLYLRADLDRLLEQVWRP